MNFRRYVEALYNLDLSVMPQHVQATLSLGLDSEYAAELSQYLTFVKRYMAKASTAPVEFKDEPVVQDGKAAILRTISMKHVGGREKYEIAVSVGLLYARGESPKMNRVVVDIDGGDEVVTIASVASSLSPEMPFGTRPPEVRDLERSMRTLRKAVLARAGSEWRKRSDYQPSVTLQSAVPDDLFAYLHSIQTPATLTDESPKPEQRSESLRPHSTYQPLAAREANRRIELAPSPRSRLLRGEPGNAPQSPRDTTPLRNHIAAAVLLATNEMFNIARLNGKPNLDMVGELDNYLDVAQLIGSDDLVHVMSQYREILEEQLEPHRESQLDTLRTHALFEDLWKNGEHSLALATLKEAVSEFSASYGDMATRTNAVHERYCHLLKDNGDIEEAALEFEVFADRVDGPNSALRGTQALMRALRLYTEQADFDSALRSAEAAVARIDRTGYFPPLTPMDRELHQFTKVTARLGLAGARMQSFQYDLATTELVDILATLPEVQDSYKDPLLEKLRAHTETLLDAGQLPNAVQVMSKLGIVSDADDVTFFGADGAETVAALAQSLDRRGHSSEALRVLDELNSDRSPSVLATHVRVAHTAGEKERAVELLDRFDTEVVQALRDELATFTAEDIETDGRGHDHLLVAESIAADLRAMIQPELDRGPSAAQTPVAPRRDRTPRQIGSSPFGLELPPSEFEGASTRRPEPITRPGNPRPGPSGPSRPSGRNLF